MIKQYQNIVILIKSDFLEITKLNSKKNQSFTIAKNSFHKIVKAVCTGQQILNSLKEKVTPKSVFFCHHQ